MKFAAYLILSFISVLCTIYYAFATRGHFYPSILFLMSSKVALAICCNFVFAICILVSKLITKVFIGTLRDSEIELLVDMLKIEMLEMFFAFTLFRNEFNAFVIAMLGGILFLKGFHFLAKTRVQYLEQAMPQSNLTHGRLQALNLLLLSIDVAITVYCMQTAMNTKGRTISILFGFEGGLLIIGAFSTLVKYYLYLADTLLENGLPSKGLYTMVLELVCDGLKVVTYVCFFLLIFSNYGLPLHILR